MAAIGIARADDGELPIEAGADGVLPTLDELDLAAPAEGRLGTRSS